MSFVGYLLSINSSYYICGDFNIHVDVSVGDGYIFITFLDSCDLKQSHIGPHSISPDCVSDHSLVKCTIAFPHQVAHTNRVPYRRYHCINMSDFCSDLKNTFFVKSPSDAVVDLYEQYACDWGNVLDSHAPLISRLTNRDSVDWMSDDLSMCKVP